MYMGSTKQIPWFIFEKEKDMELGWEQCREVVVDPPEGREMEMNIYEYNQNSLHEILKDSSLQIIYKLMKRLVTIVTPE